MSAVDTPSQYLGMKNSCHPNVDLIGFVCSRGTGNSKNLAPQQEIKIHSSENSEIQKLPSAKGQKLRRMWSWDSG